MENRRMIAFALVGFAGIAHAQSKSRPTSRPAAGPRIERPKLTLQTLEDRHRITVAGKPFADYIFKGQAHPVLYPLFGPGGQRLTRGHPIETRADEAPDHPHHRSLWFAHGDVNGHDFWSGKNCRVVQDKWIASHGTNAVILEGTNRWLADGQIVLREKRTVLLLADEHGRLVDFDLTLHASEGDVVFGDTKEGTMAIRMHPALRLRGKVAKGKLLTSEGIEGKKAWGKRARWVTYWGPIDGAIAGIAIFDHPENHGHPCRWHARGYGLCAANPFGIHHFERAPRGTGDFKLANGEKLRLRYRFWLYEGKPEKARIEARYKAFLATYPAAKSRPASRKR